MATNMNNPVENFGLIVSLACVVSGAFLLYDGTNSQFQVIGGAALLSVGLVVALLVTKSRWQEESNSLREKLKSMVAAEKKKIVLNVANIKYIDSTGLGMLVAAHFSAKTQGASVRLCHLGKKFHEIMQVTKLLTVFDVYDTQTAAVSSFQAARAIAA